jgi:hypothetical protein
MGPLGLDDSLVCSKHAMGTAVVDDVVAAIAGERSARKRNANQNGDELLKGFHLGVFFDLVVCFGFGCGR